MRLLPEGSTQRVLLAGALAALAIAVLTGLIIYGLHEREARSARQELGAFDTLLAEQTARAVESVALVVARMADDLHARGIATADQFAALRLDRAMHDQLLRRTANIPQLEAISLTSDRGELISTSLFFPAPRINVSDREYYRVMHDAAAPETMISAPVLGRATGLWNIYLARRLSGADGAFVGLILGVMKLDYFERLYESISTGAGATITMWREDGLLLARFPHVPLIGQRVVDRDFRSLADGRTVVRANLLDLNHQPRLMAMHRLPNGLVVEVSETMSEVFAEWRRDSIVIGLSGLACMGAAVLVVLALIRQLRSLAAMSVAVAGREEAVRARQRAEERMLEAQKMEAIGRLTSGVAHDFNNLLTSVGGNVELLLRDPTASTTAARRLSVIQAAADRGATLVRQLLAFSRQQVLAPRPVALVELLAGLTELLSSTLGRAVQINRAVPPDCWEVMVDPAQFEHLLLNLATNARDAMPEGGELWITASNLAAASPERPAGLPAGDFVIVSVRDSGCGMTAEVLAHAFDPFFTTKPPGRGSGLGLSQVYGVARQSGGLAQLHSAPGAGTTVSVYLPRARPI